MLLQKEFVRKMMGELLEEYLDAATATEGDNYIDILSSGMGIVEIDLSGNFAAWLENERDRLLDEAINAENSGK